MLSPTNKIVAMAISLLHALRFGTITAAVYAGVVTVFIVTWEWLENPGGIFRGDAGTAWPMLYDTAISWLLPTFGYLLPVFAAGHLIWSWLKGRRSPTDEPPTD